MLKTVHSSPGRVRLKYAALSKNPGLCISVTETLLGLAGIVDVRCNAKCRSLIINYDPSQISISRIVNAIMTAKPVPSKQAETAAECECAVPDTAEMMNYRKAEFAGLSALLGASFVSRRLFGRAIGTAVFSPFWFGVAVFALPLAAGAVSDLVSGRRTGLKGFLGTGVAAALAAGETMTALEILWVNSGSELLQKYVTEKSRKSIKNILDVTAKTAFVLKDGEELELPVEQVQEGDTVIIRTGEKISVDGTVFKGEALVNEAPLNGRQDLIVRAEGEKVFAGTYVQDGLIYVRAEKVGDSTYLSRILQAVEDSLGNKAPMELAADKLARKLVTLGFIMTGMTWLLTRSFYRTLSVMLVMTCPCATTLAASSAVSAAIGNAASKGILIKGGRYLEDAGDQESFCFDKTGTITTDTPEVTSVYTVKGVSEEEMLRYAYAAELHNRHPVAAAVRQKAEEAGIEKPSHSVCETILGMGVAADTEHGRVFVGSRKLMEKCGIKTGRLKKRLEDMTADGSSALYIAKDTKLLGLLAVKTRDKEGVEKVISSLREDGVTEMILVTGDEQQTAVPMAERLGFDECHCSVLPRQKAEIIAEIQKTHKVTMIGDGINDVLALAQADLGIAMGAVGSDVAIEAADIALVDDDLRKIVYLRQLSHKTKEIINQNFTLATGSNIAGAFLGLAGFLNPVMAGLLHIAHTGGVLANSSRLISYKGEDDAE